MQFNLRRLGAHARPQPNGVYYQRICSCYRPHSRSLYRPASPRLIIQSKHCTLCGAARRRPATATCACLCTPNWCDPRSRHAQIKQFDESININYIIGRAACDCGCSTFQPGTPCNLALLRFYASVHTCVMRECDYICCACRPPLYYVRGERAPARAYIYVRSLVGPINLTQIRHPFPWASRQSRMRTELARACARSRGAARGTQHARTQIKCAKTAQFV